MILRKCHFLLLKKNLKIKFMIRFGTDSSASFDCEFLHSTSSIAGISVSNRNKSCGCGVGLKVVPNWVALFGKPRHV